MVRNVWRETKIYRKNRWRFFFVLILPAGKSHFLSEKARNENRITLCMDEKGKKTMRNGLVWEKGTQHSTHEQYKGREKVFFLFFKSKEKAILISIIYFASLLDDQDTSHSDRCIIEAHSKEKKEKEGKMIRIQIWVMHWELEISPVSFVPLLIWIVSSFLSISICGIEKRTKLKIQKHVRCPEDRHYSDLIESTDQGEGGGCKYNTKNRNKTSIKMGSPFGCYSREIDVFHSL